MLENKYSLNTEDKLDKDFSPEINAFWDGHAHRVSFQSIHGGQINTMHLKAGHRHAIVISQGRNESALKYKETAFDLHCQGYDVFFIDHRGQGLSSRLGGDAHRGHVQHFEHYIDDLTEFVDSLHLDQQYQTCFLFCHSMGGAIGALYLEQRPHPFQAAVFFSPMLSIHLRGFSPLGAKLLSYATDKITHLVSNYACYAPKSALYQPKPFTGNQLTHSQKRYASAFNVFEKITETQLGGPTMRWVYESLKAIEKAIAQANKITIPSLLIQSGNDTVVTEAGQQAFFNNLNDNIDKAFITIAQAKHELLMEEDQYRVPALTKALDFINTYKQET